MNKNLYLTICLAVNAFLIFCVAASTTNTSIGKKSILNMEVKMLVPQGWGFFTKNPQEDLIDIYQVDNKGLHQVIHPSADWHNLFGISRKYRRLEAERTLIQNQVASSKWTYTKPALLLSGCEDNSTTIQLNSVKGFNGTYLICKTKRIPWAWAKLQSDFPDITQYTLVDINSRSKIHSYSKN